MRTVLLMMVMALTFSVIAQDVQNSRRMSQMVVTTRTMGTTDVTVTYHSPLAKGRKIFGGIVPFDFVVDGKEYAWRAGSNNRTTIEFTHDVTINGSLLKAGKYGLVVLVSEKEWTFVFSSNLSWGAFQYDPTNDVLRVPAKVQKMPHQEWLSYDFINPKEEEVEFRLWWEESAAVFAIATDVNRNILSDLEAKDNKSPRDYRVLAIETLVADSEAIDKAMEYLDLALSGVDTLDERSAQYGRFSSTILMADLMVQKGESKKGRNLRQETLKTAEGFNIYYYALNTLLVKGNQEEALELLLNQMKRKPNEWQTYLALGEYYLHDGNQQLATDHFRKSYELAPENWKNYTRYLYLQNKLILERS